MRCYRLLHDTTYSSADNVENVAETLEYVEGKSIVVINYQVQGYMTHQARQLNPP